MNRKFVVTTDDDPPTLIEQMVTVDDTTHSTEIAILREAAQKAITDYINSAIRVYEVDPRYRKFNL